MKLIQAMKKIKDLNQKAQDLRVKIGQSSADLTIETAMYPDQKRQVQEWMQAHADILKEILRLRLAVQRTNLATDVTIELNGHHVTKPIAGWIHRRRDLAGIERECWEKLTDRNLKEQNVQTSPGGPVTEVRIRRYYDPVEKDNKIAALRSEPSIIDGHLEIVNATTDLVEE